MPPRHHPAHPASTAVPPASTSSSRQQPRQDPRGAPEVRRGLWIEADYPTISYIRRYAEYHSVKIIEDAGDALFVKSGCEENLQLLVDQCSLSNRKKH